jgi:HK97 family phage major capsid protein
VPGSLSSASELLQEQVAQVIVAPLEATSVVYKLGPRVFTSQGGTPVRVPKFIDFATDLTTAHLQAASPVYGAWKSENELIDEDEPTWDELVLLPRDLKSVKIMHRMSSELARLAVVDVVNAVRDALVRRVALELDHVFLRGDGSQNTPTGLLHASGRQTHSHALDLDSVYDVIGLALAANATPKAWIAHPDVWVDLRQLKDDQHRPLLQPDPTQANAFTLVGLPFVTSTLMPSGRVLLLDPTQIAVARDLDTSVTIDSSRYLDYDQVAIRVITRHDIGALNAAAIVDWTLS